MSTPSQDLGYKVGDTFRVTEVGSFNKGDIVRLEVDDGSTCLYFRRVSNNEACYEYVKNMESVRVEPKVATTYSVTVNETSSLITVSKPLSADVVAKIVALIGS